MSGAAESGLRKIGSWPLAVLTRALGGRQSLTGADRAGACALCFHFLKGATKEHHSVCLPFPPMALTGHELPSRAGRI